VFTSTARASSIFIGGEHINGGKHELCTHADGAAAFPNCQYKMLPAHWNVGSQIRSMLPLSTEIPWIKSNIFLPPAANQYVYYTQACMGFTSLVTDKQARYPTTLLNMSLQVRRTVYSRI